MLAKLYKSFISDHGIKFQYYFPLSFHRWKFYQNCPATGTMIRVGNLIIGFSIKSIVFCDRKIDSLIIRRFEDSTHRRRIYTEEKAIGRNGWIEKWTLGGTDASETWMIFQFTTTPNQDPPKMDVLPKLFSSNCPDCYMACAVYVPQQSSDDLCLLFCINPSSMIQRVRFCHFILHHDTLTPPRMVWFLYYIMPLIPIWTLAWCPIHC